MIQGVNKAVDDVRRRIQSFKEKRAVYLAATGTMVDVGDRAWGRGELTDGSTLSYKEDYELYAYTPPSPRKVTGKGKPYAQWKNPPKGKTGARDIKGGYYKSYQAGFKSQQGRADAPFELTGRFRKAYFAGATQDSDTVVTIRLNGENASKYVGLTDTKGPFLKFTQAEIEAYQKRVFDIYNEP